MIYVTREGDQLDAVCFKQYGTSAAAETVLETNPFLADLGAVYPAGIEIDWRCRVMRVRVRFRMHRQ